MARTCEEWTALRGVPCPMMGKAHVHSNEVYTLGDVVRVMWDTWSNGFRVWRCKGACVVCGARTYGFDDGEDDPRGPLGLRAYYPYVAADSGMQGADVVACYGCHGNDSVKSSKGLKIAKSCWTKGEQP